MVDPDLIRCREKWTWTSGTFFGVKLSGVSRENEVLNHDFQFAKTELVLGCCTYWILLVDFIPMKYEYFGDRAACTDSIFLYHHPAMPQPYLFVVKLQVWPDGAYYKVGSKDSCWGHW
jgi:hypothetical protein